MNDFAHGVGISAITMMLMKYVGIDPQSLSYTPLMICFIASLFVAVVWQDK